MLLCGWLGQNAASNRELCQLNPLAKTHEHCLGMFMDEDQVVTLNAGVAA